MTLCGFKTSFLPDWDRKEVDGELRMMALYAVLLNAEKIRSALPNQEFNLGNHMAKKIYTVVEGDTDITMPDNHSVLRRMYENRSKLLLPMTRENNTVIPIEVVTNPLANVPS